jgi:dTDP-4-dehydrorhamnose reductase
VDVRDEEAMRRAAEGVDVVVHTAYRQRDEAWSTNADGSHAVAAAARRARLIHLSSDVVFRGDRGRYTEDDAPDPVNDYGRSKAAAERVVRATHPEALIVRTSLLYGGTAPAQGAPAQGAPGPQERLAREGTTFFVDEIRSPVVVGDLADALIEVATLDVSGPLHLGGADDVSRYEFALLLGADPARIEAAYTTPDRAPNVSLDSSCAHSLLATRLRGVREVFAVGA